MEPLYNRHLGPDIFGHFLLQYRGFPVLVTSVETSDVQYISKYRDTLDVSRYDIAMLVYRYFYKFKFCTI